MQSFHVKFDTAKFGALIAMLAVGSGREKGVTSITYLESESSVRIYDGDIVKQHMLEIKDTGTAKFDCT